MGAKRILIRASLVDKVFTSRFGIRWIERLFVFEHTEGDVEQFTHRCANDDTFTFAVSPQPLRELLDHWIVFDGHDRRHVKSFAQSGIAYLGQPAFFVDGFARPMSPRAQPRIPI